MRRGTNSSRARRAARGFTQVETGREKVAELSTGYLGRESVADADGRYQLKQLSHTHEAIAIWLMENPAANLSECAAAFGFTSGWLSQIIHSDLFQLRLANMRQQGMEVGVLALHERMSGVAALCLEKLAEKVATCENVEVLTSTANMTLRRLGYGSPKGAVIINNNQGAIVNNNTTNVDKALIADARALMSRVKEITEPPTRTDDRDSLEGTVTHKDYEFADPFTP